MNNKLKAYLLLLLSALMWGSSFPVIKLGLNSGLAPIGFLGFRLFISVLIVVPFLYKEINFEILKDRKLIFLGLTNAGGFLFQYFGQKYTSSNTAAVISNLLVIFVAILSFIILKESMNLKKGIGVILSFIGLGVISNLSFDSLSANKGILIMLISPLMWAFFVILSKNISSGESFKQYLFPIYFYTFVFIFPFAVFEGFKFSLVSISLSFYLAVFCTVVPYLFFLSGLKFVGATTASIITSFQIFFSIIIAFFFLGETISLSFFIGIILVFLAIYLVETH